MANEYHVRVELLQNRTKVVAAEVLDLDEAPDRVQQAVANLQSHAIKIETKAAETVTDG